MNESDPRQQRAADFLRLLPLTIELAGLPEAEHGKYYTDEQIELRANAIRRAYKEARQLLADLANA